MVELAPGSLELLRTCYFVQEMVSELLRCTMLNAKQWYEMIILVVLVSAQALSYPYRHKSFNSE